VKTLLLCSAVLLQLSPSLSAEAKLREEQIDVPVKVADAYGKAIEQSIKVTVFSDDANRTPAPVMVLNHGRAAEAAQRAALGRARYSAAARFFVSQGFIVAVPTRIGYGVTGGEDVEDSGSCKAKRYEPGYAAAFAQTRTVLETVRSRPDADRARAVILGQSYGGTTSITAAAQNLEGVVATINFSGGGGGNPKTHPEQPCGPQRIEQLFGQYGKTARIPTLWIYTENDRYFGPEYPREWFKAFKEAGGTGEFVQFPPHGEDGHSLFTRFPEVWQPRVREFLSQVGFAAAK
jgi:dienelactone hydrolase